MTSLPTPKAVQIGFSAPLSLPVLLHDVSKSDAARITKLDIETFRDESWKPMYFGVKRSRSRVTKNIAGVGICTLVSAGFFWFTCQLQILNKQHV